MTIDGSDYGWRHDAVSKIERVGGYGLLPYSAGGWPRRRFPQRRTQRQVGMSDRRRHIRSRLVPDPPSDEIERESQDSFPASDAPSWTPVTRIGTPILRKGE